LPVPAVRVNERTVLVSPDTVAESAPAAFGLYARVGCRLVVLDDGEVDDDLVGEMVEVLTSLCARLYGRRSARNRALKAVGCAQRDIGPKAVVRGRVDDAGRG
jgi:predicted site-specific integrase-resolvase